MQEVTAGTQKARPRIGEVTAHLQQAVFPSKSQVEFLNSLLGSRPSRLSDTTLVIFRSDQPLMPSQQRIRCHQIREPIQRRAAQQSSFDGQPAALAVIKPRFFAQQCLDQADFFLLVFNDLLLVAVHPTGNAQR